MALKHLTCLPFIQIFLTIDYNVSDRLEELVELCFIKLIDQYLKKNSDSIKNVSEVDMITMYVYSIDNMIAMFGR